jgi:hypothetical protein
MNVEAIKIDLTTSHLTQKQIAEKHGVTASVVNKINLGYIHAEVEPKTAKQRSEPVVPQYYTTPYFEVSVNDQEHLDFILNEINRKPGWPKIIAIKRSSVEDEKWIAEVLKKREKVLQIKLAKVRLMINAIENNDFSDLPPSCLVELEEARKQLAMSPPTEEQTENTSSNNPSAE